MSAVSRKRSRCDEPGERLQHLQALIEYLKRANHRDPAYAAGLLRDTADGLTAKFGLPGSVSTSTAAFSSAGGNLDLCSGMLAIQKDDFLRAGNEVLQKWCTVKYKNHEDSAMTKRCWEAFTYNNQLTDDDNGHFDYVRRVRKGRVVDIVRRTKHVIWQELPKLCNFVRLSMTTARMMQSPRVFMCTGSPATYWLETGLKTLSVDLISCSAGISRLDSSVSRLQSLVLDASVFQICYMNFSFHANDHQVQSNRQ